MQRLCLLVTVAILAAVTLLSGAMPHGRIPESNSSSNWTEAAWANIVRSEYEFRVRPDGAWFAPNRAQGLRLTANGSVADVTPRTEGAAPWVLSLALRSIGRKGGMTPLVPGNHRAEGNRLQLRRERLGLTEWNVKLRTDI